MGKSVFVPTILLSKSQMVKLQNGYILQKGSSIETIENELFTFVIFPAVHKLLMQYFFNYISP